MVRKELVRATKLHPRPFNSAHEGWAVIWEELDEMWDEVRANNKVLAREEAIQVAAMAVRFILDTSPVIEMPTGSGAYARMVV
jgi:hypothetical protein